MRKDLFLGIRCGHCKARHATVALIRLCAARRGHVGATEPESQGITHVEVTRSSRPIKTPPGIYAIQAPAGGRTIWRLFYDEFGNPYLHRLVKLGGKLIQLQDKPTQDPYVLFAIASDVKGSLELAAKEIARLCIHMAARCLLCDEEFWDSDNCSCGYCRACSEKWGL